MEEKNPARTILWHEIAAFVVIIAVSWLNELLGVPARVFGGEHHPNIPEAMLETTVVVAVATPIVLRTRRVVARLFYLESFVKVCAWCQKVEEGGRWVPISEFLQQRFDTATSHGMCPSCVASQSEMQETG
jgi:hypothetical protein